MSRKRLGWSRDMVALRWTAFAQAKNDSAAHRGRGPSGLSARRAFPERRQRRRRGSRRRPGQSSRSQPCNARVAPGGDLRRRRPPLQGITDALAPLPRRPKPRSTRRAQRGPAHKTRSGRRRVACQHRFATSAPTQHTLRLGTLLSPSPRFEAANMPRGSEEVKRRGRRWGGAAAYESSRTPSRC